MENDDKAALLFDSLFPNLKTSHEAIHQILIYLDQTMVNPQILPRVIHGIQNIMLGTGNGEVIVHIRGNRTTVEARETQGAVKTNKVDINPL